MALSIETIRNDTLTSIHGRRLSLDRREMLLGTQGVRQPYDDATSDTTGTAIKGYGITVVDTTTDDTWLLENPIPGAFKYIYTGTTSTGIRTIKRQDNTFAIRTSAASTLTTIVAQGGALMLVLYGISSAIYGVVSRPTGFSSACSTEMALNGTT
jgi:hypothetical protein